MIEESKMVEKRIKIDEISYENIKKEAKKENSTIGRFISLIFNNYYLPNKKEK